MLSHISHENCSSTPLGAGETFTGTEALGASAAFSDPTNSLLLPDMMLCCFADTDCTLYVDFSTDGGANYDSVLSFDVSANANEFHTIVKGPRRVRVRVVNGSTPQTALRLFVAYGHFRQGNLPIGAPISRDADATVVRSVSADLDLALGRFGGMIEDTKFGGVALLDSADSVADIWDWASDDLSGAPTKTFPTSAAAMYIASDAAGDTSLTFTCDIILADGSLSQVEVTTDGADGTTPVALGVSGLDCNRIELTGADQAHAGNIYVQQGSGFTAGSPDDPSIVLAFVRAGYGQTQQTHFTVPAGKRMRVKRVNITVARASGAAGSAEIRLWVKNAGQSWVVKREWELQTGVFSKPVAGIVPDAGSQVRMDVEGVSDNDTNITGEIVYDLVDA